MALGSPRDHADIRYWAGFSVPDPIVVLERRGRRSVVVSMLDRELARGAGRGLEVFTPDALPIPPALRGTLAGWAAGLLRRKGIRTVSVSAEFPVGTADALRRAGVRLAVHPGPLAPGRAVKSADEIRKIAECQRAAVRAMRAAIRLIAAARVDAAGYLRLPRGAGAPRPAVRLTAEHVREAIERELAANRCTGDGTIVACGEQAAMPHGRGRGPLRANRGIVIDIFPRHREHGYWGDLTRTVVKGAAPPPLRRMHAAVKAAQAAALARLRAGVGCRGVHRAAAAELARRGFRTGLLNGRSQGFIHSTGHGVGLEIHEAPTLGSRPGRLRAGHVVTVEPGLYYFPQGGVRIEDVALVQAGGCRLLARGPDVFEIRGPR